MRCYQFSDAIHVRISYSILVIVLKITSYWFSSITTVYQITSKSVYSLIINLKRSLPESIFVENPPHLSRCLKKATKNRAVRCTISWTKTSVWNDIKCYLLFLTWTELIHSNFIASQKLNFFSISLMWEGLHHHI